MTDRFDHPDPDYVPTIKWGARIPLRWERVGDGSWHVWPPKRFMLASDGSEWQLGEDIVDRSFYKPVGSPEGVASGSPVTHEFGHKSPFIEWGDDFPANWNRHDDGRLWVQLGTLRARCGDGLVYFGHFYRGANFIYPSYYFPSSSPDAWTSSPLLGRAEFMGYAWGSGSGARHWRTPTGDGRWRLGQLRINPPKVRFDPCDDLMPLEVPTEDEIEAMRQSYLGLGNGKALERGDIHYVTMAVDLSRNSELMARIGEDAFSAQVQRFMADHDLVRKSDGASVYFGSDRNYGAILSWHRRYGETYMMYDSNWAEADPDAQRQIERMFADAGYVIADHAMLRAD
jgi:hypothetical protein